ncbi:zf-HC2 domain-containing protein [Microbacterium sp.]|uniref:zf-HC2 domain-containing protein n=1 Tax=Microbacterium sp. TaxID=51671 RepID=UPI003A90B4BB
MTPPHATDRHPQPEHETYAQWDAAYVLGALSPGERADFERHLQGCDACRTAVLELAPTVGLLARVGGEVNDVGAGGDAAAAEAVARHAIASLDRRHARRRRRTRWVLAVAAAALVVAVAIAVPVAVHEGDHPTTALALQDVGGAALQASVRLTSVAWGTRIDLDCLYPDGGYGGYSESPGGTYELAVVGTDGVVSTVSTWRAEPGRRARVSAGTALPVAGIGSVEIRAADGVVVMRRDLSSSTG